MKKIIVPVVIAVIVVVAIGGFFVFKNSKNNQQQLESQQEAIQQDSSSEESDSMVDKITDELAEIKNGKSMKCVYTIKMGEGEFQSEAYVQGEKYKSISTIDAMETAKTYAIFDGKTQYSWIEGQTEGFKMDAECASELGGTAGVDEVEEPNSTDIVELDDIFENAVDVKCDPIEKIDFSIPTNITFIDQCQMLKDQMEQIEKFKGSMPSIDEMPEMPELPSSL